MVVSDPEENSSNRERLAACSFHARIGLRSRLQGEGDDDSRAPQAKTMKPLEPLLPYLIPLAGAWLTGMLFSGRAPFYVRRWLYSLTLVVVLASLFYVGGGAPEALSFPLSSSPLASIGTLEFVWDTLSRQMAFLLIAVLSLVGLSMLGQPMGRFEAVSRLILVGAAMATCSAADLFTLSLAWGLSALALLAVEVLEAPDEEVRSTSRIIWFNLISTALLVMANVLASVDHDNTPFSYLASGAISSRFLMLAAVLRLGLYPLVSRLERRWVPYLVSLCTAGYLWLRIGGLISLTALPVGWLSALGGGMLFATGLLASLSADAVTALPYMLLNGITLMVLAPLLNSQTGFAVAFITVMNMGLAFALLQAAGREETLRARAPWGFLPVGVALGSLAGWPLTAGFLGHWAFLSICQTSQAPVLFFLASMSYVLVSVPVWQRLQERRAASKDSAPGGAWGTAVWATALAVILVLVGLTPEWMERVWGGSAVDLSLVSPRTLLSGAGKQLQVLAFVAALGPLLGGYAMHQIMLDLPRRLSRVLHLLHDLLSFEWLHWSVQGALNGVYGLLGRALVFIEESFYMVWVLVWSLAVALYLVVR